MGGLGLKSSQELSKKIEALENRVNGLTAEHTQPKKQNTAYDELAEQVKELRQLVGLCKPATTSQMELSQVGQPTPSVAMASTEVASR